MLLYGPAIWFYQLKVQKCQEGNSIQDCEFRKMNMTWNWQSQEVISFVCKQLVFRQLLKDFKTYPNLPRIRCTSFFIIINLLYIQLHDVYMCSRFIQINLLLVFYGVISKRSLILKHTTSHRIKYYKCKTKLQI